MINDAYRWTDDVYGRAVYATVSDNEIVNYFIHNGQLIVSTYNSRTTVTTETVAALPRSLS